MHLSRHKKNLCETGATCPNSGASKLVQACPTLLPAFGCVSRIYPIWPVIDLSPDGARVIAMVEGMTFENCNK